jgi:hypothetical protein
VSRPLFVVKDHRHREAEERVIAEGAVLDQLQRAGEPIAATEPRMILCERIGQRGVLVQTALTGQPMPSAATGNTARDLPAVERDLRLVADWLAALHRSTGTADPAVRQAALDLGQAMLVEFHQAFDPAPPEAAVLDALAARLPAILAGGACLQHGDFCRENILLAAPGPGTPLRVIDWTDARPPGLPVLDLFFFATTYFRQVRLAAPEARSGGVFALTFLRPNAYNAAVLGRLRAHCTTIGIDPGHLGDLFGLFLIHHAVYEYRKLLESARDGTLPNAMIHRGAQTGSDFRAATRQQVWVQFFRDWLAACAADPAHPLAPH